MDTIRILGIAGSLRKGSFNRAALRAARVLVPQNVVLEIFELDQIPIFNQDVEKNLPASVRQFKERIRAADAILFVTPEYNYSFPGVLKNAIDWASRPYGDSAWQGKPVAVMGASVGVMGSLRAQHHLRQVLISLDMPAVSRPEVAISKAAERFDRNGNLADENCRTLVSKLLVALTELARVHAARRAEHAGHVDHHAESAA